MGLNNREDVLRAMRVRELLRWQPLALVTEQLCSAFPFLGPKEGPGALKLSSHRLPSGAIGRSDPLTGILP